MVIPVDGALSDGVNDLVSSVKAQSGQGRRSRVFHQGSIKLSQGA
jgi:hypothetical protein